MPEQVDWGDESIKDPSDRPKFWAKPNHTHRICVIERTAAFAQVHFIDGLGYVQCNRKDEGRCVACNMFGEPRVRIATNVIEYATAPDGKILYDVIDHNGVSVKVPQFNIVPWTFSSDKFSQLRQYKREWGDLRTHDIEVTLNGEEKYQRMNLSICRNALWLSSPVIKELVIERYNSDKTDVEALVARVISNDELPVAIQEAKKKKHGGKKAIEESKADAHTQLNKGSKTATSDLSSDLSDLDSGLDSVANPESSLSSSDDIDLDKELGLL